MSLSPSHHERRPHPSPPDGAVQAPDDLRALREVGAALEVARAADERTVREQVEVAEIPAPPFREDARAIRVEAGFREAGLLEVKRDEVGNVTGVWPGRPGLPPFVLSAHLDTVFPEGTDCRVQREDDRYVGPGITDDARGLAVLLATARSLVRAGIRPLHPILFVATVGEEGPGNLRGVKHLFGPTGAANPAHGFVSLDGAGMASIVVRSVGSVRLRFRVVGPGGHSWSDWGEGNPLHGLARGVATLLDHPLPERPRATVTVARWGGGRSINSIPDEGWVEVDLRSEDQVDLQALERATRNHLEGAIRGEGVGGRSLALHVEEIGRRPGGATSPDAPLVRHVVEASRLVGVSPRLTASSTDANVPMSLGLPAITIGAGGEGGNAHTLDEWYCNTGGAEGVVRSILTTLAGAGVEPR